jgi:hypothetical protein
MLQNAIHERRTVRLAVGENLEKRTHGDQTTRIGLVDVLVARGKHPA